MLDIDMLLSLVKEYFLLADGALILHHNELLLVVEIKETEIKHPYAGKTIYISRRALKHMVESRRKDLQKNHSDKIALGLILSAVSLTPEVITDFDSYELDASGKHFYKKDFSKLGQPNVRVLLELYGQNFHIKSIHFSRRTKKHHLRGAL